MEQNYEKKEIIGPNGKTYNSLKINEMTSDIEPVTKEKLLVKLVLKHPQLAVVVIMILFSVTWAALGFALSQFLARREFIETTYVGLIQEKEELVTKSEFNDLDDKMEKQNEKIEQLLMNYGEVKGLMYKTGAEPLKSNAEAPVLYADMVFEDKKGEQYTADELVGDRVLISYMEDGKEIYFLGKYNSSYHWEGYCVTNSYNKDGTLSGICESNFDDGERLDYISLYQHGDYFIYSNRIIVGNKNIGITKHYEFDNSDCKMFDSQSVSVHDIQFADSYLSSRMDIHITEYYNGMTSNEEFCDDTGGAVRVTFDDDGFVENFYKGKFFGRNANDDTMKAYALIYVEGKGYYYNHDTVFENGKAKIKSAYPLENDELIMVINNIDFDEMILKWHGIDDVI